MPTLIHAHLFSQMEDISDLAPIPRGNKEGVLGNLETKNKKINCYVFITQHFHQYLAWIIYSIWSPILQAEDYF